MTESSYKSNNNLSSNNQITVKLNRQIIFTNVQIEDLLRLPLLNKEPHVCVSLVSSTLKLENIKENNVNLWLADTLTLVVKNIQRTHMSVLQGIVVMFWVIHYMSLVIEGKLSKVSLFEDLRARIKAALTNADQSTIPLPNCAECPKYQYSPAKRQSSVTVVKSNNNVPVRTMAAFVVDTVRRTFWDDFKYAVVQMACNAERSGPSHDCNDCNDCNDDDDDDDDDTAADEKNRKRHAITDRYFFRALRNDARPPSSATGRKRVF